MEQFKPVDYYKEFVLSRSVIPTTKEESLAPHKNGEGRRQIFKSAHIFGSVFAEIKAEGQSGFSGDIGSRCADFKGYGFVAGRSGCRGLRIPLMATVCTDLRSAVS